MKKLSHDAEGRGSIIPVQCSTNDWKFSLQTVSLTGKCMGSR